MRLWLAWLLALCLFCGCGRIGIRIVPLMDASVSDASRDGAAAESGMDAALPDGGLAPVICEDPGSVAPRAVCGCGQSDLDDRDADGVPDCIDFCPARPDVGEDGTCACGSARADQDGDGTPNCSDRCPFDGAKQAPGLCGCGVPDRDPDGDGVPDCSDGCPADPGMAKTPTTMVDDATVPGNGIDDDCDGRADENVPACDTTPRSYEAGSHSVNIPGNCHRVTVRLWGGGGAAGGSAGLAAGGEGGPGGYATASVLVSAPIQLYVGGAAATGCNDAGTNAGSSSYSGGSGGTSSGANGADGVVSGGGSGGQPSTGASGGNGYYGGGGGGAGQGSGGLGGSGNGGGGGAASVLIVNGSRALVAGGGGGGGGAQSVSVLGSLSVPGGAGRSGCRGNGQAPHANGGGGGGGGMCLGGTTQAGWGIDPAFAGDIPSGRA